MSGLNPEEQLARLLANNLASWCLRCDRVVFSGLMMWTQDGWYLCDTCRTIRSTPPAAVCAHGKNINHFCGACREAEVRTGVRKAAVPQHDRLDTLAGWIAWAGAEAERNPDSMAALMPLIVSVPRETIAKVSHVRFEQGEGDESPGMLLIPDKPLKKGQFRVPGESATYCFDGSDKP